MANKSLLAMILLVLASLHVGHCLSPLGSCHPSGYLRGKTGHCNTENDSDCCKAGKLYPQYRCSPPTTGDTPATMTINSFAKGGDGGGPSECDSQYHSDAEFVVALSTGWYNGGSRCLNNIKINANGRSVMAKVVDECDSVYGCDSDHDFQPPCPYNIVDASPAVWKALGIPKSEIGDYDITWSDSCHPSGYLRGKTGNCNRENDSDCCEAGKLYPQYHCSPPITGDTSATMTINSFAKGGDGGGPSECDNKYHSDDEFVVALSTGWYNGGSRCLNSIKITANGRSVMAKVVDECDSVYGCDSDHDFQPPCPYNIVDASPAVWKALGIPKSEIGDYDITWSDA
ncbi:uncharacterized protein LOC143880823 [Tasmannia lanceolata]|uniref:uncharacterized protein LOC143880823 n=1 Tax=Tasmannia lanceolata TaxID=3420 RepID=UPI0040646E96